MIAAFLVSPYSSKIFNKYNIKIDKNIRITVIIFLTLIGMYIVSSSPEIETTENSPDYLSNTIQQNSEATKSVNSTSVNIINDINTNNENTQQTVKNTKTTEIVLKYSELGEYGKYDIYDGNQYIRYYLPSGTYKAKALTENAMFFIVKQEIYKNSFGYDESATVSTTTLSKVGDTEIINIASDCCIELTINSSISFTKK